MISLGKFLACIEEHCVDLPRAVALVVVGDLWLRRFGGIDRIFLALKPPSCRSLSQARVSR